MESVRPESAISLFAGCFMLVFWFAIIILTVLVFCKIFAKAGYHWAMGLIMLVPLGNVVMLLILAFSEWPIERQLKAYQQGVPPAAPFQA